ncbi:MAG: hypothetical protein ACETVX_06750 [bacterium]
MKKSAKTCIILLIIVLVMGYAQSYTRLNLDLETGLVFSGYNDVQIPKSTGTRISLSEELKTDPTIFFRAKLIYSLSDRHKIAIFAAPLRLKASGKINREVSFEDSLFPADTLLKSLYRFDSYRLTYRYDFYQTDKFEAGIGLTAKIRDAAISLEGAGKKSEKTNTGFVPLINFRLQWMLANKFGLLFEGDALAAPQGRAEDVLLAMHYKPANNLGLKLGYRILEGGADVEEVYNFTLINYIVLGAILAF